MIVNNWLTKNKNYCYCVLLASLVAQVKHKELLQTTCFKIQLMTINWNLNYNQAVLIRLLIYLCKNPMENNILYIKCSLQ